MNLIINTIIKFFIFNAKEIRCPICGGNKYEKIRPNTFKCIYCHSIFTVEDEIETKNVQEQGHTTFEESNNKNKTSYVNTFNQEMMLMQRFQYLFYGH